MNVMTSDEWKESLKWIEKYKSKSLSEPPVGSVSAGQFAEIIGKSRQTAKAELDALVKNGELEQFDVLEGSHHTLYYRPKDFEAPALEQP